MLRELTKPWFETEDKPTQQQYWTFFDRIWFKDELLPVNDEALLLKLDAIIYDGYIKGEKKPYNGDGDYTILDDILLETIIVRPGSNCNLKIGNGLGDDDILPEIAIDATKCEVILLNLYAKTARTIYLTGLPSGSDVIFLKRQIIH